MAFELAGQATAMVRDDHATHNDIYRMTGWNFTTKTDGIVLVKKQVTPPMREYIEFSQKAWRCGTSENLST